MPIRKYVLPILLQPFPQYQMSRKEIREYITSNANEDGNLWCYLTVSLTSISNLLGSISLMQGQLDIKCNTTWSSDFSKLPVSCV